MIYVAPENIAVRDLETPHIFLAGSIEMGVAENWQDDMAEFLEEQGYGVFNPRRKDWDESWIQEITNPQFYQQVNWELNALEKADLIVLYLSPGTVSPISLLELGLHKESKIIVICPKGFSRKGNVDIVCDRYGIPLFESIKDFKSYFKQNF